MTVVGNKLFFTQINLFVTKKSQKRVITTILIVTKFKSSYFDKTQKLKLGQNLNSQNRTKKLPTYVTLMTLMKKMRVLIDSQIQIFIINTKSSHWNWRKLKTQILKKLFFFTKLKKSLLGRTTLQRYNWWPVLMAAFYDLVIWEQGMT